MTTIYSLPLECNKIHLVYQTDRDFCVAATNLVKDRFLHLIFGSEAAVVVITKPRVDMSGAAGHLPPLHIFSRQNISCMFLNSSLRRMLDSQFYIS